MRTRKYIIIVLVVLCAACSPTGFFQERQENKELDDTIVREKKLWEEFNVDSYQIEVRHASVWEHYTVINTVKDNKILNFEVRCDPGNEDYCKELPTKSYFRPDDYTVQGVFKMLEESRRNFKKEGDTSWSDGLSVTFDTQYHYPTVVNFDFVSGTYDDDYTIQVLNFKPWINESDYE